MCFGVDEVPVIASNRGSACMLIGLYIALTTYGNDDFFYYTVKMGFSF